MRKKNYRIAFILFLLIFSMFSSSVNAHEIISGFPLRWYDVKTDNNGDNYCDLKVNGDYLTSTWENRLNYTCSRWNSYSDGYVSVAQTSFSTSKVDYANHASWPSEWGSNTVAITLHYDDQGRCLLDGYFSSNGIVNYAQVYTNPIYDSVLDDFMKTLVMGHEMGHVVGLGHPSSGTVSIMTQSQTSYDRPQDHDRTDLENFYN